MTRREFATAAALALAWSVASCDAGGGAASGPEADTAGAGPDAIASDTQGPGDGNTGDGNTGDGNTGDGDTGDGDTGDARAPRAQVPRASRGAPLYAVYCAFCHGAEGEGYVADQANQLANQSFLATATDAFLAAAIEHGRPGTPMAGWGPAASGPLSAGDVADVVALLRSWQTEPTLDVHGVVVDGLASRGRPIYNAACASCHGPDGEGATAVSVSNPWLLTTASDGFLRHAIAHGRPGTPMPGFEATLGAQAVDDLVALLRSWEREPGAPPPRAEPPDLTDAVLNAGAATPDFALREGRYVAADDVHEALLEGAALVILDTRPPSDFAQGHIQGAVNLPFYDVADYAEQLPDDVWIVGYCGCPHAISDQAVDALRAAGRPLSATLDEGWYVWLERGYPATLP